MRERKFSAAIGRLQELTQLYPSAEHLRLLGICYLHEKQPEKALPVLQRAVALRPYLSGAQETLAEAYRQLGKNSLAKEHQDRAHALRKRGQK
jgi:predicted Zn-dependent protease